MHEDDHLEIIEALTGWLLLRPQVRDGQLRSAALQPHEELLEENEINNIL